MNTALQPERHIVVRAVYVGKEPTFSKPREPFFLANVPIVEAVSEQNKRYKTDWPLPFHYVDLFEGSVCYDFDGYRVGIEPKTQLALFDIRVSVAETFNDVKDWRFERLSWTKYREILANQADNCRQLEAVCNQKLTEWWPRFFGLQLDSDVNKVTRVDLRLGKHPKDPEFPSTERFHYHVNLKKIKPHELFSAIEYIEQAFHYLGVDCDVGITFDTEEVYRTPKGLVDEKKA